MTEKIEHRIIDPRECPRCGGHRTESLGRDGTPTETRQCLDCLALDPDSDEAGLYDVVYGDEVQSVNWDEGMETVYDSRFLAEQEAMNLLAACEKMKDRITELENERDFCWNDWTPSYAIDATIARAKGETDEPEGEQP